MEYVAGLLDTTPIHVMEVATFYTMYNKKPIGKYHVQVCRNLACALLGAERLVDVLQSKLGIKVGETTSDKMFSLSTVECLAACDGAPCLQVNDIYHLLVKTDGAVDQILDAYRQKSTGGE